VAAGAAATAGAVALYAGPRVIHRLEEDCGFPPETPPRERNVTVTQMRFNSRVLGSDVGIVEIEARAPAPSAGKALLLLALPGRDGTAEAHAAGLHLAHFLGAAVRRRGSRGARMIVVDSGNSYWHARRHGENRMKMLIEEIVIPRVRRDALQRSDVGIIGWSMGAYGAFLAAEKYPELFGAVCGVSVALWPSAAAQMNAVPDAFDDAADFERNDLRRSIGKLKGARIRLACGRGDPFFPADQELAGSLRAAHLRPQIAFSAGCHDDNFWQRSAPADLDFLVDA
jgi:enterochelin esterase-like enzyme